MGGSHSDSDREAQKPVTSVLACQVPESRVHLQNCKSYSVCPGVIGTIHSETYMELEMPSFPSTSHSQCIHVATT